MAWQITSRMESGLGRRKSLAVPATITTALVLAGCVAMPVGPSMTVLPGTGKSFDQFRHDDYGCRQYAFERSGGVSSAQAANNTTLGSAAVGTALGAAAGAAFDGGSGAAIGAGLGLLTGAAVGAGNAQYAGYGTQQQYDAAYVQCMYTSGHRVPVYGAVPQAPAYAAPAPAGYATPAPARYAAPAYGGQTAVAPRGAPGPGYYYPPPPPGYRAY